MSVPGQAPRRRRVRAWVVAVLISLGSQGHVAAREHGAEACHVGVLTPGGAVDVSAGIGGKLVSLTVQVGQEVQVGETIAQVESLSAPFRLSEQAARVRAAKSSLDGASIEEQRAGRELERRRGAPQLFSKEQIEAAEFQARLAALERQRREAALAEAEAAFARLDREGRASRVTAPSAGTVSARFVHPGAEIVAGQPLVRVLATAERRVRFAVRPADAPGFPPGTEVSVLRLTGAGTAPAVVEAVAPMVDPEARLIFVEASLSPETWPGAPAGTVLRVRRGSADGCLGQTPVLGPE